MAPHSEFQEKFDVSRETIERLTEFEALLRKWTAKINLVSKSTLDDVWRRHFVDSAQVFTAIEGSANKIADFGSGGGFPGIVVAIVSKERSPDNHLTLIESDLRKATFLSTAVRDLNLNAKVHAHRVEALDSIGCTTVTARALAPLTDLFSYSAQHLQQNGKCLFLKGERYEEEVAKARETWDFDLESRPSLTHSAAALLKVWNLRSKH